MAVKPAPRIDATNAPFWRACNDERVLLQRCTNPVCARFVYYPRVCCPHCRSGALEWTEIAGHGRIVTYTVVHRVHHEGFANEAPYLFAAVELDEGPLIYARLDAAEPAGASLIGRRVEPIFLRHSPDQKLLGFRLTHGKGAK